jgi:hypothetical protein
MNGVLAAYAYLYSFHSRLSAIIIYTSGHHVLPNPRHADLADHGA